MPGPFSATTVEAVSACTRTLAGSPEADAALTTAGAATLSGLRAAGDRFAVRQRFHDPAIHRRHQPSEPEPSDIYTLVEVARLDALGVAWLPGIAKNLLAHPGAADDGLRWLVFEALSGRPAPPVKTAIVAKVRAALPSRILEELSRLATEINEPSRFAPAAAAWARAAAPHVPPSVPGTSGSRVALPTREVVMMRHLPDRGDPGGTSAPLKPQARSLRDAGDATSAGASVAPGGALDAGYRAYTTAHDRVVDAAALASREELAQLRVKLQKELSTVRSVVARLAKRLLRVLLAQQVRRWDFDLEEGVLDGARLASVVASRGHARPFKRESESPFPSTVVSLLIDHSGSMRGRPMQIAALTVEIFARVLERCGVACEVLGFTTREWDGGEPAREWAANRHPENPGRLNALEHIVIKAADVPWRRARVGLGLFLRDDMLKENIDGEALIWAHSRLMTRPEARKILVVISDGMPMDEATMAANGHEYLERHLQQVVDAIERGSPVQLAAIGIGHDVSAFYRNATRIARIEHLGPALTFKLVSLLGPGGPTGPGGRAPRYPRAGRAARR